MQKWRYPSRSPITKCPVKFCLHAVFEMKEQESQ